MIQSGKGQFGMSGSADLGMLLGLITGDGHFTNRGKGEQAAIVNLWGVDRDFAQTVVVDDQHDDRGLVDTHRVTIASVPSRFRSAIW